MTGKVPENMKYYINTSKKKGRSKKVKVDDFEKIRVTRIFDELYQLNF